MPFNYKDFYHDAYMASKLDIVANAYKQAAAEAAAMQASEAEKRKFLQERLKEVDSRLGAMEKALAKGVKPMSDYQREYLNMRKRDQELREAGLKAKVSIANARQQEAAAKRRSMSETERRKREDRFIKETTAQESELEGARKDALGARVANPAAGAGSRASLEDVVAAHRPEFTAKWGGKSEFVRADLAREFAATLAQRGFHPTQAVEAAMDVFGVKDKALMDPEVAAVIRQKSAQDYSESDYKEPNAYLAKTPKIGKGTGAGATEETKTETGGTAGLDLSPEYQKLQAEREALLKALEAPGPAGPTDAELMQRARDLAIQQGGATHPIIEGPRAKARSQARREEAFSNTSPWTAKEREMHAAGFQAHRALLGKPPLRSPFDAKKVKETGDQLWRQIQSGALPRRDLYSRVAELEPKNPKRRQDLLSYVLYQDLQARARK